MTDKGLWKKIDYSLVEGDAQATGSEERKKPPFSSASWKRTRRLLDLLGTLFWVYVLLKIFFFDVDYEIVKAIAPGRDWLVDFRFLFFLAVLAIVVAFIGVREAILGGLYILLFPLIVALWKIPKLVYKSKSWIVFFAAIHVVAAFISNFRYIVLAATGTAFATVFVLFTDLDFLLVGSMGLLACLVAGAVVRTLIATAKPAGFIRYQEKALDRLRKSKGMPTATLPSAELKNRSVTVFTAEQQNQFLVALQSAVLVQRLPLFWAFQLDEYRRSPAPIIFTALSYAWLVLQSVIGISLVNYALFKLDSTAFDYASPPSLLVFARYTFSSLASGEIAAVQPDSSLANTIFLGTTALGIVFLLGIAVGLFLSFRQKSEDAALRATINGFREQGRKLEEQLRKEYDVESVAEAMRRLEELRAGLLGLVTFFSSRIPPEFEQDLSSGGQEP